jgi:hypothetical protein
MHLKIDCSLNTVNINELDYRHVKRRKDASKEEKKLEKEKKSAHTT